MERFGESSVSKFEFTSAGTVSELASFSEEFFREESVLEGLEDLLDTLF